MVLTQFFNINRCLEYAIDDNIQKKMIKQTKKWKIRKKNDIRGHIQVIKYSKKNFQEKRT